MENFWKLFRKLLGNIWEILGNLLEIYGAGILEQIDIICDVEKGGGERAGPGANFWSSRVGQGRSRLENGPGRTEKFGSFSSLAPLLYGEASIYQIHGTQICHVQLTLR